jgi:hypothetical protein
MKPLILIPLLVIASAIAGYALGNIFNMNRLLITWAFINIFVSILQISGLYYSKKIYTPAEYYTKDITSFEQLVTDTWGEYSTCDPGAASSDAGFWLIQMLNVALTILLVFGVWSNQRQPTLVALLGQIVLTVLYIGQFAARFPTPGVSGMYLTFVLAWIGVPVKIIQQIRFGQV